MQNRKEDAANDQNPMIGGILLFLIFCFHLII